MGEHTRIPVALSTASVYPASAASAFDVASRLGYDGVEVMVTNEPVTQEAGALKALADHHDLDIVSIHAPTLLITQRVWGTDPWVKVDRSLDLAEAVGAATVVLHPPFRWQRGYAEGFVEGVRDREAARGIRLAVENMYPWRAGGREIEAYLPHWDPTPMDYRNVTLDLSHTATSGSDAYAMAQAFGPRLAHLHLADGNGSALDEHLVPGRGSQPCGAVLELLTSTDFAGSVVVEVATRRLEQPDREVDLTAALAYARLHLDG